MNRMSGMVGRRYLVPGYRLSGIKSRPEPVMILACRGPGGGPRNVSICRSDRRREVIRVLTSPAPSAWGYCVRRYHAGAHHHPDNGCGEKFRIVCFDRRDYRRAVQHGQLETCTVPRRSLHLALRAGRKGPKTNDGDSSALGSSPKDSDSPPLLAEIELSWQSVRPRCPVGFCSPNRGGCLEGTRCADPRNGRHARGSRASGSGRPRPGPVSAAVELPSPLVDACVGQSFVPGMPWGGFGMRKAPQGGAFPYQDNGPARHPDDGQSSGWTVRNRGCGSPGSGHFTYGARR